MKKEPCKYHCRCMNLDNQCPNPHFMDANCTCEWPFIPASEKDIDFHKETCTKCKSLNLASEKESHKTCTLDEDGACEECGQTEPLDWMEEFDEILTSLDGIPTRLPAEFWKDKILEQRIKLKSFIDEKIGEKDKELEKLCLKCLNYEKQVGYGIDRGRQEEKARIVKMIEKDGVPTKHHNQSAEFRRGYSTSLDDLLNNLKKDE